MMSHSGLVFLFSIFYLDLLILKQRNREIFAEVFFFPPIILNSFIGLILFFVIFSADAFDAVSTLAILGIMPLYIIRRFQFVKLLNAYESYFQEDVWRQDQFGKLQLLSDACGVAVAWILSSLLIEALTDFIFPSEVKNSEFINILISSSLSSMFLLWLIFKISSRRSPNEFKQNLGLINKPRSFIKTYLIPAIVGFCFAGLSSWLVEIRQIQPDTPLGDLMANIDSSWMIMGFLFLAIIIAPFVEELVFRGYFFYVLDVAKGRVFAFVTVALIFAVLHVSQYWGDWLAIGMVAVLGFVLTFLRVWTGSTWASITAHYFYNAAVTIIPVVMLVLSNPAYLKYQVYFERLDSATKEALLTESIQKDPKLADAYNDLAWLYLEENKNLDRALELVDQALSFDDKSLVYLDTKAAILEKKGLIEEAQKVRNLSDLQQNQ